MGISVESEKGILERLTIKPNLLSENEFRVIGVPNMTYNLYHRVKGKDNWHLALMGSSISDIKTMMDILNNPTLVEFQK